VSTRASPTSILKSRTACSSWLPTQKPIMIHRKKKSKKHTHRLFQKVR
jgi:hypothetical protein